MIQLHLEHWSSKEESSALVEVDPSNERRYLVGDKAYSSAGIRQQLRRSGTTAVIPKRSNEKRRGRFNRGLYRERNPCRAFD